MTTAIDFEESKQGNQLAQGRYAVASPQDTSTLSYGGLGPGAPSGDAGNLVDGAIKAHVGVRLRKTAHQIRGWLRVDTANSGQSYGFDSDSFTEHVSGTTGDPAATITALKAAVEADADAINSSAALTIQTNTAIVEYALSSRPVNNTSWPGVVPPSLTLGGTGAGNPYASGVAESRECYWRIWGRLKGATDAWVLQLLDRYPGGLIHSRESCEMLELDVAHLDRVFVEVVWSDGVVIPIVAVAELQAIQDTKEAAAAVAWTELYGTTLLGFGNTKTGHVSLGTTYLPLAPGLYAPQITTQQIVAVGTSSATLLPRNPARRGFLVRNLGAATVYLNWKTPSRTAATTGTGLELRTGEIREMDGADAAPTNELMAISASGSNNVYAEDR